MIVELLNKEYTTYDAFSWKDPHDLFRGGLKLLGVDGLPLDRMVSLCLAR